MQSLSLNSAELRVLSEILIHELSNLNSEIAKTDDLEFRNSLKQRRDVIETLLENFQGR